jgi:hypothetical protein
MDQVWLEPKSDSQAQRLVPAVSIKNPTQEGWKNLSIGLNKQFYAQEPKGIPAGGSVTLPLEAFVARNGSVRFPPHSREVTHVTVFAQIETGARAVSEFRIPAEQQQVTTAPRQGSGVDWISPNRPSVATPSPR